jgi:O-antigen biosynthesis protein
LIDTKRESADAAAIWVGSLDLDSDGPVLGVNGRVAVAHAQARVLVRMHGAPLGYVSLPAQPEESLAERVAKAATTDLAAALDRHAQWDSEACEADGSQPWETAIACPRRYPASGGPGITIVICTRDRPELLEECLRSMQQTRYQPLEIVVVDNAPSGDLTRQVVSRAAAEDPRIRYTSEPHPGLSRARNHGLSQAKFDIVAFTDDDTLPDPGWPTAIAAGFAADPETACVTGLVLSGGLETASERYFDARYAWGQAFEPCRYDLDEHRHPSRIYPFEAGVFGTGANFAVRRSALADIGVFDPLLGAGGPGRGGEDLDLFVRVILAGGRICYLPSAFVWHRHRTEAAELREQIYFYGHGLGAYLAKHLPNRELRGAMVRHGPHQAGLLLNRVRQASLTGGPGERSWRLALTEARGLAAGLVRYARAARHATKTSQAASVPVPEEEDMITKQHMPVAGGCVWVGMLDLDAGDTALPMSGPIRPDHEQARVLIRLHKAPLGYVSVAAQPEETLAERARIEAEKSLAFAISRHMELDDVFGQPGESEWAAKVNCPGNFQYSGGAGITVLICTRDRPLLLGDCLRTLQQLCYDPFEILVVDNAPSGNETKQIVAALAEGDPRIRYECEPRPGKSLALNHGLAQAKYEIVAITDDDALADEGWLAAVDAAFAADPDVVGVTGLVSSSALDTSSQRYFDARYTWGEFLEPRCFDLTEHRHPSALYPYSAGVFGTGANFAVRRKTVLDIGGFDPLLGAGSPRRGGADLDMFLRLVLTGGRMSYLPSALIWHRHRADAQSLNKQIYSYGHGLGAYLGKHMGSRELRSALLKHGFHQIVVPLSRMRQASQAGQLGAQGVGLAAREALGILPGAMRYWFAAGRRSDSTQGVR